MEQLVARRAHNPKVVGSSPAPATEKASSENSGLFYFYLGGSSGSYPPAPNTQRTSLSTFGVPAMMCRHVLMAHFFRPAVVQRGWRGITLALHSGQRHQYICLAL